LTHSSEFVHNRLRYSDPFVAVGIFTAS